MSAYPSRFPAILFAVLAALTAVIALSGVPFFHPTNYQDLPPSFAGDRLAYFLALGGLMYIVCLAANIIIENVATIKAAKCTVTTPICVSAMIEICWMTTILIGFAPDTIVLLGWGETPLGPMVRIDRILDFLCVVPFTMGCILRIRGTAVVNFQLSRQPVPVDLWPTWGMVRHRLYMLGMVVFIALGVALAK